MDRITYQTRNSKTQEIIAKSELFPLKTTNYDISVITIYNTACKLQTDLANVTLAIGNKKD